MNLYRLDGLKKRVKSAKRLDQKVNEVLSLRLYFGLSLWPFIEKSLYNKFKDFTRENESN